MRNVVVMAVTIAVIVTAMLGCSEKTPQGSAPPVTAPKADGPAVKENLRAAKLKEFESRAAQSDAEAQLSLAKLLLDGSDTPPNYRRAKELLFSASSKELPEAVLGLWILRSWNLTDDNALPDSNALKTRAIATGDPFVIQFLFSPNILAPIAPPDSLIKAASTGYPLANAKLALYYGLMGWHANQCKHLAAISEFRQGCIHASRVTDAGKFAVSYATAIMDAKEVDADKQRYWTSLIHRVYHSRSKVSDLSPLSQKRITEVKLKADPYSTTLAEGIAQVGKMLKESPALVSKAPQAAVLLRKASELGNSEAQNALGELYRQGRGVPKDFELSARYFAQAAQQGEADGAKNIGLAFARGEGAERNLVQAYFWLSIAAMDSISQTAEQFNTFIAEKMGDPLMGDPGALRDKLARSMNTEEIADAQRRVREWRPTIQVGPPPAITLSGRGSAGNAGTPKSSQGLKKAGTGTAFFVSNSGHAVTNFHVVDGCAELRVSGRDGLAKKVTDDTVNDLALIQLPGTVSATAAIAKDATKLRQGDDIVVFGFPLDSVLSSGGNLTPGVVSALTGLGNNTNQLQITAPIQPGSSGSPVMNKKGEVVGVVSMKLSDSKMARATGSIGQNVNFAVSGQTLKLFLDNHKVDYKAGGFLSFDKGTADLADEAREWTLVVECWK
jgi:TPR repeat protein